MTCFTPTDLTQLRRDLGRLQPGGCILAGGTDLTIQLRHGKAEPAQMLYLGNISQLQEIQTSAQQVRVGAMAAMAHIAAALAEVPELRALADAASDVGSPQIRNKATIAGNLCNASPAGDLLPVCWMLDARAEVLGAGGETASLPVRELILGPRKTALAHNQVVTHFLFDRAAMQGWHSAFCKIGSREMVSIARESMALALRRNKAGIVEDARITVGAVAPTPLRVEAAEALLRGKPITQAILDDVAAVVAQAIHENCRPANRLYKTEAARGLTADTFAKLLDRTPF